MVLLRNVITGETVEKVQGPSALVPVTARETTVLKYIYVKDASRPTPASQVKGPERVTFMFPTRSSNDLKVAEFL